MTFRFLPLARHAQPLAHTCVLRTAWVEICIYLMIVIHELPQRRACFSSSERIRICLFRLHSRTPSCSSLLLEMLELMLAVHLKVAQLSFSIVQPCLALRVHCENTASALPSCTSVEVERRYVRISVIVWRQPSQRFVSPTVSSNSVISLSCLLMYIPLLSQKC